MDPTRWWHETHDIHGLRAEDGADAAIARVAARTGGVVDRLQLAALGLDRGAVEHRIACGRLRRVHRGVFAVGHDALTPRGRLVAGLMVAGPGAALSHRTAAGLWRLLPSMPPFVEVTTTGRAPRGQVALRFHTTRRVEATRRHGLPLTTPIRTLRDLAATRPEHELERAASEALVLKLIAPEELSTQAGPGAARLRALIPAPTQSPLERAFLKAVLESGLPQPETHYRLGPYTVDFYWPSHDLVVETDGARYHDHPLARRRDARLLPRSSASRRRPGRAQSSVAYSVLMRAKIAFAAACCCSRVGSSMRSQTIASP